MMLPLAVRRICAVKGVFSRRWLNVYTSRYRKGSILGTESNAVVIATQRQPSSAPRWSTGLQFIRSKTSEADKYNIHNPYGTDIDGEDQSAGVVQKIQPAGYWSSLFQVWRTPMPALVTGLAGLLPFVGAPAYLYLYSTSFHPFLISAQLAYGAVILSFVGGIRWGFVLPYRHGSTHTVTWKAILQSVVPSVIAWGGVLVPDLTGGLLAVSSGMLLALYNDLRLFGDYPKWMMGLRCLLTTVAIAMLLASVVLVEENRMKNTFGRRTKNTLLDKEIN